MPKVGLVQVILLVINKINKASTFRSIMAGFGRVGGRVVRRVPCKLPYAGSNPVRLSEMTQEYKNPCGHRCKDGYVYTPYITKKGVRIYHPTGGVFTIPCSNCSK